MKNDRQSQNSALLFGTRAAELILIMTLAILGFSTEVSAVIMTFTHEGIGSGTLAGNTFPVSHFVITAVGDTDNRKPFLPPHPSNGWSIEHTWASISIANVGDFEFLTGTRTFVNNTSNGVGFSRAYFLGGGDLFDGPHDTQFAAWDMLGPIGPISGTGWLFQWDGSRPQINTSGGILIFDDNFNTSATFKAIPEPATILLFGLGVLFLRKRKSGFLLPQE